MGQFIDDKLPGPPGEMPYQPITPQQWIKAVRGERSQTATGPDGVSKQDLLSLPYPLTCQLLEMFHHIEQGGEWPQAFTSWPDHSHRKAATCTPSHCLPTYLCTVHGLSDLGKRPNQKHFDMAFPICSCRPDWKPLQERNGPYLVDHLCHG